MRNRRKVCVLWVMAATTAVLVGGWSGQAVAQSSDGLLFESSAVHPGKLDFFARDDDGSFSTNLIWWSPSLKGGIGLIDPELGEDTRYAGGFFRPLVGKPEAGELIIGIHGVDSAAGDDLEAQLEYRWNSGWGVGGGVVERDVGLDIRFAKLTYRNALDSGWSYIFAAQAQEFGDETSPGGYAAFYDSSRMVVVGSDGEQWRVALGYVAPKGEGRLRPAAEILYVDNDIGTFPGAQFLFANASLGFKGGFLSHPARLGRAMGPTGLEFGNPLGFLRPTWNRRLNVWELGGIADFRVVRLDFPNGTDNATYEAVLYPFQLDGQANRWLDALFAGASYSDRPNGATSPGYALGFAGRMGFLTVSAQVEHLPDFDETRAFVGLIDWF